MVKTEHYAVKKNSVTFYAVKIKYFEKEKRDWEKNGLDSLNNNFPNCNNNFYWTFNF